jgi:hypothetical protein
MYIHWRSAISYFTGVVGTCGVSSLETHLSHNTVVIMWVICSLDGSLFIIIQGWIPAAYVPWRKLHVCRCRQRGATGGHISHTTQGISAVEVYVHPEDTHIILHVHV